MTYMIVAAGEVETFERLVNEAIDEGWTPLGGVAIGEAEYERSYFQALTKPGDVSTDVYRRYLDALTKPGNP